MHYLSDQLIATADEEAEGLIGWMRVGIAVILAATTAILVLTADELSLSASASIALVAAVVALYFFSGLISVYVVNHRRYRPWMAWAFGLGDVVLVSAYLYLATAIAGASSSVVLSAPAALLVCLIFVLQSFRYRILLQASLSLVLVSFVAALLFAWTEPVNERATQDFLSSGFETLPNIARIVVLGLIAALSAFAVWRSRELLIMAARQTEMKTNAERFLPAEFAQDLSDVAIEGLRKGQAQELVIMFVDIRGFAARVERLGAEQTSAFLGTFRSIVIDAVSAHNGVIDKFIGDGALVVFGLDGAISEATSDATNAARDLVAGVRHWNSGLQKVGMQPVSIAIALHSGTVVAGAIGDARRLELTIVGNAVNEASRIENFAKQQDLTVVASRPIVDASAAETMWVSRGEHQLRGRSQLVHLYNLEFEDLE